MIKEETCKIQKTIYEEGKKYTTSNGKVYYNREEAEHYQKLIDIKEDLIKKMNIKDVTGILNFISHDPSEHSNLELAWVFTWEEDWDKDLGYVILGFNHWGHSKRQLTPGRNVMIKNSVMTLGDEYSTEDYYITPLEGYRKDVDNKLAVILKEVI
jgi:hypothetical protein